MTQYKYVEDLDRVLEAVAEQPGITTKELVKRLGRQYSDVLSAINRLKRLNKLNIERAPTRGRTLYLYPNHTKP